MSKETFIVNFWLFLKEVFLVDLEFNSASWMPFKPPSILICLFSMLNGLIVACVKKY